MIFNKSNISIMPEYFSHYIEIAPNLPINKMLLENNELEITECFKKVINKADYSYAPNKWTIKQIFQHIIDTERIMAYRLLCIVRDDKNELLGYDENAYADNANVTNRTMSDMLNEFHYVRQSNILMLDTVVDFNRSGIVWGKRIDAISLIYVMVGHPLHHMNVVNERY